jgi:hypothetical protein
MGESTSGLQEEMMPTYDHFCDALVNVHLPFFFESPVRGDYFHNIFLPVQGHSLSAKQDKMCTSSRRVC